MDTRAGPRGPRQRHRVHPVARPRARARIRRLSRAVALVGDRPRRLLAGGLGLLRHRGLGAADRGPRPQDHARCRLVPRGQAELRTARAAPRAARPGCPVLPVGDHAARGAAVAGPRERRPRARHPAARHGRPPRRPGRLLHAEHPADGDRDARHHQHRRGVDQLLPRLRRARGQRQVRTAVTEGAVLRGQLPLRRPGLRPQRRHGADHRAAARPGAGNPRAGAGRAGGHRGNPGSRPGTTSWTTRRCRPRGSSSSRCPSAIRCGSCSPPAPPACPRRSPTATAASSSSN